MWLYLIRRILLMIPTLFAVTLISFAIIEAPPGDYLDSYVNNLISQQQAVDPAEIEALRARYGLGQPWYVRYFRWMNGILHGDLGRSLEWNQPVSKLILERLPWSLTISLASFAFSYLLALPIGLYSATHQYSPGDYAVTLIGFLGLAIPNFLLALIILWIYFKMTGKVAVGLFSDQYQMAPWSFAKFVDLLKHVWLPAVIVGTAGTAGLIRVMRANLLDELEKPYVMVARSKGLREGWLLFKYPFRIALNPVVSTIGWTLPALVNGELLASLVLGLPTIAPLFVGALMSQDMFLAGSIVLILSTLTLVGTLISDVLLAWLDPRIREAI
ncbi:ABC transporter permease [Litorilinea aerophila]|uniref:ABC transporter permease n=1 Tax=Litorilinea aerophila TaxID=1204385 RepID=A0A540VDA5_9CHLR|nr:ABC transporter permease [Litorilinea aerophila]MCC9077439.1 ABC transporter permease [Litorilinea aerophila]OUC05914.1 ABC transporter permease [Litorilinea aerophila]